MSIELTSKQRGEVVERLKEYIKENGEPYYIDGEKVIDKGFGVCNDDMFEHINGCDMFYQIIVDEHGKVYRAYYDIDAFEKRFLKETGFEWQHDFSVLDFEIPDSIDESELNDYLIDDLDSFIEMFVKEYDGNKILKIDEVVNHSTRKM